MRARGCLPACLQDGGDGGAQQQGKEEEAYAVAEKVLGPDALTVIRKIRTLQVRRRLQLVPPLQALRGSPRGAVAVAVAVAFSAGTPAGRAAACGAAAGRGRAGAATPRES